METNLLDRMLNAYLTEQTAVTVTLQNKIRVSGKVMAFDSYVIVMESQKREILYRHAVSSLALAVQEEQKRQSVPASPTPAKTVSRPQKSAAHKPRPAQNHTPLSLSTADQSINNGMKEGLLKWMQEQKATQ
jgi:host factor-I protein